MTRHSNLCGQSAWRWFAVGAGGRFSDESGKAWDALRCHHLSQQFWVSV